MKKTIATLFILTILIGCKNPKITTDEEVLKDSPSIDSTAVSKTQNENETSASCTVYRASGKIISKNEADLFICLPKIINNDNSYTIAEVYDVSYSGSNKIVIHLKDSLGEDLSSSTEELEERKFKIDLTKLKGIDIKDTIRAVVYHDNYIQNVEMTTKAKSIYALAQSTRNCNPSPPAISKAKVKAEEINIPKVCGTGTIKPLE